MQLLKIGGNELDDPSFLEGLAQAVAMMGEPVVIVHGGGKGIADMQGRLGLKPQKVDGLRVTDGESLAVALMVLCGQANKRIVAALLEAGVDAVGLSGVDGGLLRCRKKVHPATDLGYVGEIVAVRPALLQLLLDQGITAVVSPISIGEDRSEIYNVNADEAAAALAQALKVDWLTFVSNVPGILDDDHLVSSLTPPQAEAMIQQGIIRDGMIPKVRAALDVIAAGLPQVRIVNLAGLAQGGGTIIGASTTAYQLANAEY